MLNSSVAKPVTVKPESAPALPKALPKSQTKLVRGSFKMPKQDFDLIAALKERARGFDHRAKKNDLLRAGLNALQKLSDAQLSNWLDTQTPVKTKSPKKKAH